MRLRDCAAIARLSCLALGLALFSGCKTTGIEQSSAPSYVRAAENYRHFKDAGALSAYLRYSSDAGPLLSAHRGGPTPGYPENSLATMDRVLQTAPALLEVDVRMTADSTLILIHDDELARTTTGSGLVEDHSLAEIRALLLRDERGIITPFRVPTLAEALDWAEARAVLTLDVKPGLAPEMIINAIRKHEAGGRVVVIVYSIPDLMAFTRTAPDLMYSVPAESEQDLLAALDSGIDANRILVWTGVGEIRTEVIRLAHARGIRTMMGTFGEIDERAAAAGATIYEALLQSGVDIIATDRVADVAGAITTFTRFKNP